MLDLHNIMSKCRVNVPINVLKNEKKNLKRNAVKH